MSRHDFTSPFKVNRAVKSLPARFPNLTWPKVWLFSNLCFLTFKGLFEREETPFDLESLFKVALFTFPIAILWYILVRWTTPDQNGGKNEESIAEKSENEQLELPISRSTQWLITLLLIAIFSALIYFFGLPNI